MWRVWRALSLDLGRFFACVRGHFSSRTNGPSRSIFQFNFNTEKIGAVLSSRTFRYVDFIACPRATVVRLRYRCRYVQHICGWGCTYILVPRLATEAALIADCAVWVQKYRWTEKSLFISSSRATSSIERQRTTARGAATRSACAEAASWAVSLRHSALRSYVLVRPPPSSPLSTLAEARRLYIATERVSQYLSSLESRPYRYVNIVCFLFFLFHGGHTPHTWSTDRRTAGVMVLTSTVPATTVPLCPVRYFVFFMQ